MYSTHPKKNFCFLFTFSLSSANALNLDLSENLSFGRVKLSDLFLLSKNAVNEVKSELKWSSMDKALLLIPCIMSQKTNVSGVFLNQPVCLSVCVSVYPSVYKIGLFQNTGEGINSGPN